MRKVLVLGLVLLFSLTLASAALAGESQIVFYGNAHSGSISDGQHGYSWYSDTGEPAPALVVVKGAYDYNGNEVVVVRGAYDYNGRKVVVVKGAYDYNGNEVVVVKGTYDYNGSENDSRYVYYDSEGNAHYIYPDYRDWRNGRLVDSDGDGQWHFYVDAKGVRHYVYIDPDWEGEFIRYVDENGVTQYSYEVTGPKLN